MYRNYLLFELKLLMRNKKNWLLGCALLLFFPFYYMHYSDTEVQDLQTLKNEEANTYQAIFFYLPEEYRESAVGDEIYTNLTEQSSLVNNQRFALWQKNVDHDAFIESGLRVNELRLRLHELDNEGIHPSFVIPKEEINKEMALLRYYKEHSLPLVPDPFVASNYLPVALESLSGLVFCMFVLLIGSSMYVHDLQRKTIIGIFPVSFMQKLLSKVGIHAMQVLLFLGFGLVAGGLYVALKTGWGNVQSPMLLYTGGDYIAVSTIRYVLYMLLAFMLTALLLLFALALLTLVTKNVYASLFIVILILLVPAGLQFADMHVEWLYPLYMLDIEAILSGNAALALGSETLDYRRALIWLVGMNIVLFVGLFLKNKWSYRNARLPVTESGGSAN